MKKGLLVSLIIAAVLFAIGIGILVAGIAIGGFRANLPEREEHTETFSAGIVTVETDVKVTDVTVKRWEGDTVRVYYTDTEKNPLTVSCSADRLTVKDEDHDYFWSGWFWWWTKNIYTLTVELPESFQGQLILKTSTGNVMVTGIDLADQPCTVETSTGDLEIRNCAFASVNATATTGNLSIEHTTANFVHATATTGKIKLDSVTCTSDVTAESTTGDLKLFGVTCAELRCNTSVGDQEYGDVTVSGDMKTSASTGSVHADRLTAGGAIRIVTTTGGIKVTRLDAGTSLYLEATTGSIRGTLCHTAKLYNDGCSSNTGSVELPGFGPGGTIPLRVHTSTGSINLSSAD